MTGPLDESRHAYVRVSEDGIQTYVPKPYRELTSDERKTIRELASIERWLDRVYAERARHRGAQRPVPPDVTEGR